MTAVPVEDDLRRLEAAVGRAAPVLVAFSGGVDSTLVVRVAALVLGSRAVAVTGRSPSLAASELAEARRLAGAVGVRHLVIDTIELLDRRYRANAGDRCYFCKSELYGKLAAVAAGRGFAAILDGTNADDLGDDRPGLRAAAELGVRHPLVEAGLGKAAVRRLSRHLGLPTWDKPEMACLASRLPRGTEIRIDRLERVERAEAAVRALGFRQVRVRDHGELGKIEIALDEMAGLDRHGVREQLIDGVRAAGFGAALIDPAGYRRGGGTAASPAGQGQGGGHASGG